MQWITTKLQEAQGKGTEYRVGGGLGWRAVCTALVSALLKFSLELHLTKWFVLPDSAGLSYQTLQLPFSTFKVIK